MKFLEPLLFKIHQRYLEPFNTCLIPDYEGTPNLSGDLSHLHKLKKMDFIGPLSHIQHVYHAASVNQFKFLAICSGPEPARTHFEQLMLRELSTVEFKSVVVRGTQKKFTGNIPDHIQMFDRCNSHELSELISCSELIISRSGYSTIMDLAETGKNAILVPTPGQTEQEYLATYHHQAKRFFSMPEIDFSLKVALQQSARFRNDFHASEEENLHRKIDRLLSLISNEYAG